MNIRIALAGNPNSGKTTMFNALTGSHQFVGNWPGVTVEKKEGYLKTDKDVLITDLPGIYSLSPYTLEEVVARDYLMNENVDIILNIIDGTNLERNLYLTTQLLELGIPVVVAVNMIDSLEKKGMTLHFDELSKQLGCPVIGVSALKEKGIEDLIDVVKDTSKEKSFLSKHTFSTSLENVLSNIEKQLPDSINEYQKRYYSIKAFERDDKIQLDIDVEDIIKAYEKEEDDDSESIITNERYNYITSIIDKCLDKPDSGQLSTSDKIDRVLTNKWLALPIFALVMFIVYYVSVTTIGTMATDFVNDALFDQGFTVFGQFVPSIPNAVGSFLESIHTASWLQGLIVDGIIGGVGAVLGFVPQMFVLFAFLAFLEGCGYMSRIAFIMDRIFRKFGLSGKSFIPMLIGTGCSVPAIMASRTIENDRDRKITIITTSFVPCSAKLPIIALIAGAIFGGASWVAPSAYFIGIGAVIISGIILKKTKLFVGDPSPFVMELPDYHLPTVKSVLSSMWERGWSFIKRAGTVILVSTVFIWFLSNFGFVDGYFGMLEETQMNLSLLAVIGSGIAWFFQPLGFGFWQAAVASIAGLVAKENVVGTLGVLYGYVEVAEDGAEFWSILANQFTIASAYSFLIFNLLCAPCFAAMGAIKKEMNNKKWFAFAILYQTIFAYIIAFIVYQIGTWAIGGTFGFGVILAFILIVGIVYLLFRSQEKEVV